MAHSGPAHTPIEPSPGPGSNSATGHATSPPTCLLPRRQAVQSTTSSRCNVQQQTCCNNTALDMHLQERVVDWRGIPRRMRLAKPTTPCPHVATCASRLRLRGVVQLYVEHCVCDSVLGGTCRRSNLDAHRTRLSQIDGDAQPGLARRALPHCEKLEPLGTCRAIVRAIPSGHRLRTSAPRRLSKSATNDSLNTSSCRYWTPPSPMLPK